MMLRITRLFALIVSLFVCSEAVAEGPRLQKTIVSPFDYATFTEGEGKEKEGITPQYEAWKKENPGAIVVGRHVSVSKPDRFNPLILLTLEYLEADTVKISTTQKIFVLNVWGEKGLLTKENDDAVNTWVREHAEYTVVGRQAHFIHTPDRVQYVQLILLDLMPKR